MSYESLKSAVSAVITDNGNNEITGPILEQLLNNNIVPQLGASNFKGVATAATEPGTPEKNVWYLAKENGVYSNFSGIIIEDEVCILNYNLTDWVKIQITSIDRGKYAVTEDESVLTIVGFVTKSGVIETNPGRSRSDHLDVYGLSAIRLTIATGSSIGVSFYNDKQEYISGVDGHDYGVSGSFIAVDLEVPIGAYTVIVSILDTNRSKFFLQKYSFDDMSKLISGDKGVKYESVLSTNILNAETSTVDKYIISNGSAQNVAPDRLGDFETSDYIMWDISEKIIGGKDGSLYFTSYFAQYDESKVFVTGTYLTNVDLSTVIKDPNAVYFRTTYEILKFNQINYGSVLLPYEAFYLKKVGVKDVSGGDVVFKPDVNDPELLSLINGDDPLEPIRTPDNIYVLANDLQDFATSEVSFSLVLYTDHFFNFSSIKETYFESTKTHKLPIFAPINYEGGDINDNVDVLTSLITDEIKGGISSSQIQFNRVSTKLSAVATKFPKVLYIGDSVTEGTGASFPSKLTDNNPAQYWSYIDKMNLMYKNQNSGVGFDMLSVGVRNKREYDFGGVVKRSFGEGRGGWTAANYLYSENAVSASNLFYDANKVGAVKFSILKYLERYKTLEDDGVTPLVVGSTAGTLVTDINRHNLCTPTHVVIQLGFNDSFTNFQINIPLMIAEIKSELPNVIVIISIIDTAGTYYPEKYPNFNYESANMLGDTTHSKMWNLINFVKGLEDAPSGVYACTNFFTQPTAWALQTRNINMPESIVSNNTDFFIGERYGAAANLHPTTYAHASWAYQLDSLIKYTSFTHL